MVSCQNLKYATESSLWMKSSSQASLKSWRSQKACDYNTTKSSVNYKTCFNSVFFICTHLFLIFHNHSYCSAKTPERYVNAILTLPKATCRVPTVKAGIFGICESSLTAQTLKGFLPPYVRQLTRQEHDLLKDTVKWSFAHRSSHLGVRSQLQFQLTMFSW